mgnify:CR=1 FL=1
MRKNRISEFLESIDSEKWNCVYQINGMTLLTSKEYNYRCEDIVNLKIQLKKQKEVIDKIYKLIKQYIRKDGFLELNEWQTRDLLDILKEVSEWIKQK